MGIQCNISKDTLVKAGVTIETIPERRHDYDGEVIDFETDIYHFKNGFVAASYSTNAFCIDVNHWGENRGRLKQALEAHGLDYDTIAVEN